jgi:hypothetical protein
MTIQEARQESIATFKSEYFQVWRHDKPALREAWNNYTDRLCKEGRITQRQYDTWLNPFIRRRGALRAWR